MSSQLPATESLIAYVLDRNRVDRDYLYRFLRDGNYLSKEPIVSDTMVEFALRRCFYEQNPVRAFQKIASEQRINEASTILRASGAQIYPLPEANEKATLTDYSSKSLSNHLSDCDSYLHKPRREQSSEAIQTFLLNAWKKLENLLKITLLFYGRLFEYQPITFVVYEKGQKSKTEISLREFTRRSAMKALGGVLTDIATIEDKFKSSADYRWECWRSCYRDTPFGGWDISKLRIETDRRNALAHWIDERIREELSGTGGKFIQDNLEPVREAVRELVDDCLTPTTMIIIDSGLDVYGRTTYYFVDEHVLLDKDGRSIDEKFLSRRWFCSHQKKPYSYFTEYLFVNTSNERDRDFYDPKLILGSEVVLEFIQLTELAHREQSAT